MAESRRPPADIDGAMSPPTAATAGKVTAQLSKLKEANAKYKNLLKMAKERIEQQEGELQRYRGKSQSNGTHFHSLEAL